MFKKILCTLIVLAIIVFAGYMAYPKIYNMMNNSSEAPISVKDSIFSHDVAEPEPEPEET